jgi:hypothetical protein
MVNQGTGYQSCNSKRRRSIMFGFYYCNSNIQTQLHCKWPMNSSKLNHLSFFSSVFFLPSHVVNGAQNGLINCFMRQLHPYGLKNCFLRQFHLYGLVNCFMRQLHLYGNMKPSIIRLRKVS